MRIYSNSMMAKWVRVSSLFTHTHITSYANHHDCDGIDWLIALAYDERTTRERTTESPYLWNMMNNGRLSHLLIFYCVQTHYYPYKYTMGTFTWAHMNSRAKADHPRHRIIRAVTSADPSKHERVCAKSKLEVVVVVVRALSNPLAISSSANSITYNQLMILLLLLLTLQFDTCYS